MRLITIATCCIMAFAPLMTPGTPARADNNDFMGKAQRFFNNDNNNRSDDRDAYERGRMDEMRRQQAEQDRYRGDYDRDSRRGDRDRQPDYGYRNSYR
jgi:hypothetical protein